MAINNIISNYRKSVKIIFTSSKGLSLKNLDWVGKEDCRNGIEDVHILHYLEAILANRILHILD